MTSIPLNYIVSVNPSVVAAGGGNSDLLGLLLSKSTLIPAGTCTAFETLDDVIGLFGANTPETKFAEVYFSGFVGASRLPKRLYIAQVSAAQTPASLVSGNLSTLSISALKALKGILNISIYGVAKGPATLDFSTCNSLSEAATLIGKAFGLNASYSSGSGSITLSTTTAGAEQFISFAQGTLAEALKLTSNTGAQIFAGSNGGTVVETIAKLRIENAGWALFSTTWEPDLQEKINLGKWCASQAGKVGYVVWDTDSQALSAGNKNCFAAQAKAALMTGVIPVWYDMGLAAMIMGVAASLDISATNGRNTLAFRRQGQITPTITNQAQAAALEENGYNYYGNYASSDDNFQFLYPGQTVDEYLWIDSFLNQLWMCRGLQGDMINLLMNVGQIPYNSDGDTQIEAACMNTINKAVNFGAIRSGVALSESQSTQIDANAGAGVSKTLTTRGWYLSVKASTTSGDIRSRRGSPPIHLWYMDGQSVQRLNLSAVEVQ